MITLEDLHYDAGCATQDAREIGLQLAFGLISDLEAIAALAELLRNRANNHR